VNEKRVSWSLYNQTICALRFFYRATLQRDWAIEHIPFPRQERKLPIVLSLSEVARFFEAVANIKYRAILMTAYAGGLRTSEVVHLRVSDIDSQRMVIRIEQGKGHKDRYVMLSPRLLELLREYWKVVRPSGWLFPGKKPGHYISISAVQRNAQKATLHSRLGKSVTVRPALCSEFDYVLSFKCSCFCFLHSKKKKYTAFPFFFSFYFSLLQRFDIK